MTTRRKIVRDACRVVVPAPRNQPDHQHSDEQFAEGAFTWSSAEPLPAAILREAMARGCDIDIDCSKCEQPLQVEGDLDCSSLSIRGKVEIIGVRFEGKADFNDARFAKQTNLRGCKFPGGLDLSAARIDGPLGLISAEVDSGLDASGLYVNGNFWAIAGRFGGEEKGGLDLSGARINGDLMLHGIHISGDLTLWKSEIEGDVQLVRNKARSTISGNLVGVACHVGRRVLAWGCRVEGMVVFEGARLDESICFGMNLVDPDDNEPAEIGTALSPGETGLTAVNLGLATIGGIADFCGAVLEGQLVLNHTVLKGALLCRERRGIRTRIGKSAEGVSILAHSATFGSLVDICGALLEGQLYLELATLKGPLFCKEENGFAPRIGAVGGVSVRAHAASFGGPVEFVGARLEGQLYLNESKLEKSLLVCSTEAGRSWFGQDEGGTSVMARHVFVGGQVSFTGAHLEGALDLQSAEIRSEFLFQAWNEVEARIGKNAASVSVFAFGAAIGGQVNFCGARLEGQLQLENAKLNADLFVGITSGIVSTIGKCDQSGISVVARQTVVCGEVDLRGVQMEGSLYCRGAELKGGLNCVEYMGVAVRIGCDNNGGCVDLGYSSITGGAGLNGAHLDGELNLEGMRLKGGIYCRPSHTGRRTWLGGGVCAVNSIIDGGVFFNEAFCGVAGAGYRDDPEGARSFWYWNRSFWWSGARIEGCFDAADVTVTGRADFSSVEVTDWMRFDGAILGGPVDLTHATVHRELAFGGSSLKEHPVRGGRTSLRGGLRLLRTEVLGDAVFSNCQVGPWLGEKARVPDLEWIIADENLRLRHSQQNAVQLRIKSLAEIVEKLGGGSREESDARQARRAALEKMRDEADEESGRLANLADWEPPSSSKGVCAEPWAEETDVEKAVGQLVLHEGGRSCAVADVDRDLVAKLAGWEQLIEREGQEKPAVDLRHLTVKGRLLWNADGGGAINEVGGCINGECMNVAGNVRLNGLNVRGCLVLEDAVIRGELNLLRTTINGHLNLRSAEVRGQMFGALAGEEVSPKVKGKLLLNSSSLSEVMLRFDSGSEERGEGPVPYRVEFDHARISRLVLGGEVIPNREPCLRMQGLEFQDLNVNHLEGETSSNKPSLREWLRRAVVHGPMGPARESRRYLAMLGQGELQSDVYLGIERWLRNQGKETAADDVYLMMRGMEWTESAREGGLKGWLRWATQGLLLGTVGYGVKSYRLFLIWFALLLGLWAIFLPAESVGRPVVFQAPVVDDRSPSPGEVELTLPAEEMVGRFSPAPAGKRGSDEKSPEAEKGETPETDMRDWELRADRPTTVVRGKWVPEKSPPSQGEELAWTDNRGRPDVLRAGGTPEGNLWHPVDAAWVAFRVAMPLIDIYARSDWEPSSRPVSKPVFLGWLTYEGLASFVRILCYIIWPLLITSMTGLLKKK